MPDAGLTDGAADFDAAFHDTYIRQQVVTQCTSGTRPTGVEGRIIAETDTDRLLVYSGSAWVQIGHWASGGRRGVQLSRAATQSISSGTGTFTAISWDTETTDTDGYIAATSDTITIPSGLGGLYAISASVTWASSPGANSIVEILIGATAHRVFSGGATQSLVASVGAVLAVAAANTIKIRVSQGSGGAINVTATLEAWRLSA